jgi:hypothetical protein
LACIHKFGFFPPTDGWHGTSLVKRNIQLRGTLVIVYIFMSNLGY